jgi:hypothetical protein
VCKVLKVPPLEALAGKQTGEKQIEDADRDGLHPSAIF